jgi:hypothetical protein
MRTMTVLTPSFRNDFELCVDLNRSILEFAPKCVRHHIFVPRSDFHLFRRLAGQRTQVEIREELLPGSFVRVPHFDYMLNLRWPFMPVRGWIEQQLVKLQAASASTDDVVLLVDSDVQFVRPFTVETFVRNGLVRFYRLPNGVDARLPRHVRWHKCARTLLGLPKEAPPFADYVHGMIACDPAIVRQMLARVESTTGLPWMTAISRQLHFSEWTLYGVYVDHVLGPRANEFASDRSLCCGHWTTPLSQDEAEEFLGKLESTDVAAMISSKAGTPLQVRRAAFANRRADAFHHMLSLPLYFGSFCACCGA